MLLPAGLRLYALPPPQPSECRNPLALDGQFHLHPRYRTPDPLAVTLLDTQAGHDQFVSEKYHDQIAAILAQWSSSLRQSPRDLQLIGKTLAANFAGASFHPAESRVLRSGPELEIQQNKFAAHAIFGGDVFLQDLQAALSVFSTIVTAEFQVTSISGSPTLTAANPPRRLHTRVRYELVGSGRDFHREQRVGQWDLEWEATPDG
ncbi:MAG TPA: hypothetical protein VF154_18710, partial [Terriglobales bacterium]